MLGISLGVSYKVGGALCNWIMTKKYNLFSHTTIQKLTADEPRDPNIPNVFSTAMQDRRSR